jgi:flagellar L-ring protein precursor FlgH
MRPTLRALSCAVALLLGTGCESLGPDRGLPGLESAPPMPLVPPPPPISEYEASDGSLWRGEASRRFLAFENRAKRVGDIVTVLIEESAEALNEASTELERESDFNARLNSGLALQTLVSRPILGILSFLGFTDQRAENEPDSELSIIDATTTADFEGEGRLERKATFSTNVACMVTGVTPSGLLRVEGTRNLTINQETQVIRLSGWVRPEDVRIDNTVPSTLIASAQIEYSGVGVVSDEQRVPLLTRIFKLVLPF